MDSAFDPDKKPTILVVDDSPLDLMLTSNLLKSHYAVKIANNGRKGLEICAAAPPDLVLLDVEMPGLSGYDVMAALQADPATRGIPVIFVTSNSDPEEESRGLDLGAADYITKPISPPILLSRVLSQITLRHRTAMLSSLSEKLSRYLAPQVYRSIFEGKQDVTVNATRKKLTIFFSDIKDFTATTENMQPEDLTLLLNDYFSEMSEIAQAYGATIDKFVGDAMLMFFGDPETRGVEEDALQCVRMAVAMQRRMAELRTVWQDRGFQRPFRMRIGINTGYCNVGNFGSAQRMHYTIIGAAVNLAARLEQVGEADGVMLSYETHALVKDEFAFDEHPPIQVKGIASQIRCFSLKGILDTPAQAQDPLVIQQEGLHLRLNPQQLTGALREQAIESLLAMVQRLRDTPRAEPPGQDTFSEIAK